MVERKRRAVKKLLVSRQDVLRFDGVADRRGERGRRWPLRVVLAGMVLAIVAGATSVRAVEGKTEDIGPLGAWFGIRRRIPRTTIGRVGAEGVAPEELEEHLARTVRAEQRRKTLEPTLLPVGCVAVDGKAIRSICGLVNPDCRENHPREGEPYATYLVMRSVLFSSMAPLCIGQKTVPRKTNEMAWFKNVFRWLLKQYGRSRLFEVVFTDSGSCSRENAQEVHEANKGYILAVKANQPELLAEAKRLLVPKMQSEAPVAETEGWEKDHKGRWLKRRLWVTSDIAGYLGFPGLQQAFVVRTVQREGDPKAGPCRELVVEDRYFVTNLAPGHRLQGEMLLRAIRLYGQVEENNWLMDVPLGEDELPFTQVGDGLPVTTLLRVLGANLLSLLRNVHLRAERNRTAEWRRVIDWVWQTLLMAEIADLESCADN